MRDAGVNFVFGMNTSERIYIIPRWAGVVFAGAVFAIFALGYFAQGFGGLPQTLVISFVVAGIVILIQTNENLRGVVLVACQSRPVPAGGEAVLDVTLRNSSDREHFGLKVRLRRGWALVGDGWLPALKPGGIAVVRIRIPVAGRGCYPHPPLWVSSDHPVGLCFAWKVLAGGGQLVVYPRPAGQSLAAHFSGEGDSGKGVRQGVEDISGHRPYAAGDPPARLDWRVFAKSGKLAVKTFEAEVGRRVALRWEDTAFLGDREARLEQLSFWVSECARDNRPFELRLAPSSRPLNETNPDACRTALAAFPP